jgi:hypothetical protein
MSNKRHRLAPITEMLLADDKWMYRPSGPKGILARLWRRILYNENIRPTQFNSYKNDYLTEVRKTRLKEAKTEDEIAKTKSALTSLRGNMTKAFTKNRMTWPVFLDALRFVKYRKVRFTVQAYKDNGTVVDHSIDVDLGTKANVENFLNTLAAMGIDPEEGDEGVADVIIDSAMK